MRAFALLAALLPSLASAGYVKMTLVPLAGEPTPVGATRYTWFSGCVESGAYEREPESSDVPVYTMEKLPDSGRCYFIAQWADARGNVSDLASEAVYDFDSLSQLPPSPTSPPTGAITFAPIVPTALTSADIGTVAIPGSYLEADGTFTLTASGDDIWNASDAMRYAWVPCVGDCEINARVDSLTHANEWTKAGVMARSSIAPNAANVFSRASADRGYDYQVRPTNGGTTGPSSGKFADFVPYWVRLTHVGSTWSLYTGPDGVTWMLLNASTTNLGATPLIGLALTSHTNAALATAVFSNVKVSP